jgi:HTH-type transcriptional regulator, competence development regulator
MPETAARIAKSDNALGKHLAAIRDDRGFSLRRVEELTNKLVSNAYLSQIETGKVLQPSPNILHELARVYKTSYEQLMELAGYFTPKHTKDEAHGRAATFAALNLTEAEQDELLQYLKYRRSREGRAGEG